MCYAVRVEIIDCFEDLKDDEFGVEIIETLIVHSKDEIVKVAAADKRFENDKRGLYLESREDGDDIGLSSAVFPWKLRD